ncbi:hypothetical protein CDL15_Pgr006719 [Punica granatum]|uniref:Pectinesterase inhibitor domain-containing protein n=1 Tax=Punica granatum TaxID=22663 RepID=A0A218X7M1_PUNGR|nr:hypothetical protein CDL15_Pgr006719 [Punica granatum]
MNHICSQVLSLSELEANKTSSYVTELSSQLGLSKSEKELLRNCTTSIGDALGTICQSIENFKQGRLSKPGYVFDIPVIGIENAVYDLLMSLSNGFDKNGSLSVKSSLSNSILRAA